MKTGVEGRVSIFQQDVDKFGSRWEALRPKESDLNNREAALKAIATIKERRQEFDAIVEQANTLQRECSHFDVSTYGRCFFIFHFLVLVCDLFPTLLSFSLSSPSFPHPPFSMSNLFPSSFFSLCSSSLFSLSFGISSSSLLLFSLLFRLFLILPPCVTTLSLNTPFHRFRSS